MKQFEAYGTTFFYGHRSGTLTARVHMQPTAPGGSAFECEQAALEAFVEQIPEGVVARLRVRAEAAEAALADRSEPESERMPLSAEADVSFLRAEVSKAQDRIKALEAHVLRLEADARTAKRVRESIVSDVLKSLEPYRRV